MIIPHLADPLLCEAGIDSLNQINIYQYLTVYQYLVCA